MDTGSHSDSTSAGRLAFFVALAIELKGDASAASVAALVALGRGLAGRLSPDSTQLSTTSKGFRIATADAPDGLIDASFAVMAAAARDRVGVVHGAVAAGLSEVVDDGRIGAALAGELRLCLDQGAGGDLVATGTIRDLMRRHKGFGDRFKLVGTRVVDGQPVDLLLIAPPKRIGAAAPSVDAPLEVAALIGLMGDRSGIAVPLDLVSTVGRAADATVPFADASVSRAHAVLERRGDDWFLTDKGSANGTYVNGDLIQRGQAVQLADDDVIGFGSVVTTFVRCAPDRLQAVREDRVRRATLEDPRTGLATWARLVSVMRAERARALACRRPLLAFVLASPRVSWRSQAWSDTLEIGRSWRALLRPLAERLTIWETVGAVPSMHAVIGILPERTSAGDVKQALVHVISEAQSAASGTLGPVRVHVEDTGAWPADVTAEEALRKLLRSAR